MGWRINVKVFTPTQIVCIFLFELAVYLEGFIVNGFTSFADCWIGKR